MAKMTCDDDSFYNMNQGYVDEIKKFYSRIKKEYEYTIGEISGHKLKIESFYIAMIPFQPGISGLLVNESIDDFGCDDIRSEIGSYLNLKEISEFEKNERFLNDKYELNLKKCKIYSENKISFPFIRRHGGAGNSSGHEILIKKVAEVLKRNDVNGDKAIFISNWIEFGPFMILFVSELNKEWYLQYIQLTKVDEPDGNSYKYFLNTVIDNFYEKWLEFVYYGLTYSTINYISDSQAIITASANDMFEARSIPTEHIFTQIANYEYEGNPCKGKIVFTNDIKNIVRFAKPVSINIQNVKKIRKLLEMTNDDICLIVSLFRKEIVGIDDCKKHEDDYLLEYIDTNMWSLSFKGTYILKYVDGQYRLPEAKLNREMFLKKCNERFGKEYDPSIFIIIEAAINQKHGTMIVISKEAGEETNSILKEGKGTAISKINLVNQSNEMIIGLCSIDGAVMIDTYGNCAGIGLILSNPNTGKGNPERGSRYNSAVNYINNHEHSIVVVISEDGIIDVL